MVVKVICMDKLMIFIRFGLLVSISLKVLVRMF